MIYFRFKSLNPFWKRMPDFPKKDYLYKQAKLTKNKSFEIQSFRVDPYYLCDLTLDLHWWGSNHAGPELEINIWGFVFYVKIYDRRRCDLESHMWESDSKEQS
jgi:hypothetical protein